MSQIHIFQAGRRPDTSGRVYDISAADLDASARVYDPAIHEAPLVIGHPKLDAPAYGWVEKLSADHGELNAEAKRPADSRSTLRGLAVH